ncbi:methionine synthase reductase isoform X2 [Eucyclogobius newberryi]|uniref:methionine synthase reductase isoform X2 n=1 Tax=Eucyclogobius newberryi TaxID=166745 RepID=UPI003B58DAF4
MPCEVKPRFVLLYGSQKGQAQSIAEGIFEEADKHGLVAELSCLSEIEKYNLEKESAPVVFVVSTTGDGEPPDNALKFVKSIKKKTLPPDQYQHLTYALLALGDTNYANFCNCGKTIERRLQELGAKQFYATGYADDGVGLELVIDPWLEGLWTAIKQAPDKMASDKNDQLKENVVTQTPALEDVQFNRLSLSNQLPDAQNTSNIVSASKHAMVEQTVITESKPSSSETRTDITSAPSLTNSLPPLSESALNVPALSPHFLDVHLQEADAKDETPGPPNKNTLYEIPISKAVKMTNGDDVKTALLLELDISGYPVDYHPGDAFDVFCPNRAGDVEEMLRRLGLWHKRNHHVCVSLIKNTKKRGAQVPSHIPTNISLLYLLTWCLEIRHVPKKAFVRALVEYTGDTVQKRRLQELCSKQGSADYNLFVRDQSLSVLELFSAFTSCLPPLSLLIEHLPKLQPRPYSAASSCLRHPGKVHFIFNVVEFPACSWWPDGRRGLCTGWLFDLISPALQSSGSQLLPKVHVGLRANCSFRPPSDPSVPLVMVGPGTGVAPFIGFLQQREKQRQENPGMAFGETWLYFGCRHEDNDFLFRLGGWRTSAFLPHTPTVLTKPISVCFIYLL